MPSPSAKRPEWRRLVGGTLALFFVILAFLAGRMGGGADPALSRAKTHSNKQQPTRQSRSTTGSGSLYDDGSSQTSDPNPPTTSAS
jgi:hypothetical protein